MIIILKVEQCYQRAEREKEKERERLGLLVGRLKASQVNQDREKCAPRRIKSLITCFRLAVAGGGRSAATQPVLVANWKCWPRFCKNLTLSEDALKCALIFYRISLQYQWRVVPVKILFWAGWSGYNSCLFFRHPAACRTEDAGLQPARTAANSNGNNKNQVLV